uniref:Uncharacterized protein n=1 Tax=uncultured Rhodospirillales bacterium HF0200_01O14 TaxID=710787 RepID=E0XTS5_9PROT|nr:hypothetical protein [uncultured Rhodospirillales bacterium HF0200_01O14]
MFTASFFCLSFIGSVRYFGQNRLWNPFSGHLKHDAHKKVSFAYLR